MTTFPIRWPKDGLIPAVIQDESTRAVLMVGFMNAESLEETFRTGLVHFWSRSRQELWKKGGTSGHVQHVRGISINCDLNSLLIEVEQVGEVCHDGYATCYYRRLDADGSLETTRERDFDPATVYGTSSEGGATELVREWWDSYAYLRDHDLEAESGTSRLIRLRTSVIARIKDELRELAGVLDGSHVHTTQQEDVLLEGSQVAYWLIVHALQSDHGFDAIRPERAFCAESAGGTPTAMASMLRMRTEHIGEEPLRSAEIHELLGLVAQAALSLGVDPLELIRADVADLRGKPYLDAYFAR